MNECVGNQQWEKNRAIAKVGIEEAVDRWKISPRDVDILFDRYGLDGGGGMTCPELAKLYGVSTVRVSQVLYKVFRRCRNTKVAQKLGRVEVV